MNYTGRLSTYIKFYQECVIMEVYINNEYVYTHSFGFNGKNSDDSITLGYIKKANLSFYENPKSLVEHKDVLGRKYNQFETDNKIEDMPYWAIDNYCKALFDYRLNEYLLEIFKDYSDINNHFKQSNEFYRYGEKLKDILNTYPID